MRTWPSYFKTPKLLFSVKCELRLVKTLARSAAAVEAEGVAQRLGHIDALPREQSVVRIAAEMPVGGGRLIDRTLQVERLDDAGGAEIEQLAQGRGEFVLGHDAGVESIDQDRDRLGDADRVGDLDFAFGRESLRDHVFRDVTRHVARRAIDLARILARKRAAAMTAVAAVGIDDNFAAGESAVAMRSADDEAAGRIDVYRSSSASGTARESFS